MPQRIKYSTDHPTWTLQQIFDDLQPLDTLILNQDYTLHSTAFLRQRQVTILGRGAVIKKGSGLGATQPVIQIDNDNPNDYIVNNVVIDGIRFVNDVQGIGSGTSHAIRLRDTLTTGGGVYHIRLQNLGIDNFSFGVLMEDAFDIVVDNCEIQNCTAAIRQEFVQHGVGGLKIFGGFFIKNSYGISIDNSGGSLVYQGNIMLFGTTFGHDRPGQSSNISICVFKPIGGIYILGCQFEDVNNVVYFADNFPNNTSAEPMVITAVANHFFNIKGDYAIDTRNAKPHIDASSIIGNYNYRYNNPTKNLAAIPQIDTGSRGGLLMAGNALTNYPSEATAVQQNTYQVFPLPIFDGANRPVANSVARGTAIFNSYTNKINISNGSQWRDAMGNLA